MLLIRARSVVQVHPGPPFKSPINTRQFSLSPSSGLPTCRPEVARPVNTSAFGDTNQGLQGLGLTVACSEAGYRLGSDRGRPKHGSTLFSKRVIAQNRSPVMVRT